jgi:hypothetical protein
VEYHWSCYKDQGGLGIKVFELRYKCLLVKWLC